MAKVTSTLLDSSSRRREQLPRWHLADWVKGKQKNPEASELATQNSLRTLDAQSVHVNMSLINDVIFWSAQLY